MSLTGETVRKILPVVKIRTTVGEQQIVDAAPPQKEDSPTLDGVDGT